MTTPSQFDSSLPAPFQEWLTSRLNDIDAELVELLLYEPELPRPSHYCPPLSLPEMKKSEFEAGGAKLMKMCASDFAMKYDPLGDTESLTAHVAGCIMDSFWSRRVTKSVSGGLGLQSAGEFFAALFIIAQRTRSWRYVMWKNREKTTNTTPTTPHQNGTDNTNNTVVSDDTTIIPSTTTTPPVGGETLVGRLVVKFFHESAKERLYLRYLPAIWCRLQEGVKMKSTEYTLQYIEGRLQEANMFNLEAPVFKSTSTKSSGSDGEDTLGGRGSSPEAEDGPTRKEGEASEPTAITTATAAATMMSDQAMYELLDDEMLTKLKLGDLARWGPSLHHLLHQLNNADHEWFSTIDAPHSSFASSFSFGYCSAEMTIRVNGRPYHAPCSATGNRDVFFELKKALSKEGFPSEGAGGDNLAQRLYFLKCILGAMLERAIVMEGRVLAARIPSSHGDGREGALPPMEGGSVAEILKAAYATLKDPENPAHLSGADATAYYSFVLDNVKRILRLNPAQCDRFRMTRELPEVADVVACGGWIPTRMLVNVINKLMKKGPGSLQEEIITRTTTKKIAKKGSTAAETSGVMFPNIKPLTAAFIESLLQDHDILQRYEVRQVNGDALPSDVQNPYIVGTEICCRAMYAHDIKGVSTPLFLQIIQSMPEINEIEDLPEGCEMGYKLETMKKFRTDVAKSGSLRLYDNCAFVTVLPRTSLESQVATYFKEGKKRPGTKFDEKIRTTQDTLDFLEIDLKACVKAKCVKVYRMRDKMPDRSGDVTPGCIIIIPTSKDRNGHLSFPISLLTKRRFELSMKGQMSHLTRYTEPMGQAWREDRNAWFPSKEEVERVFGHSDTYLQDAEMNEEEDTMQVAESAATRLFEFDVNPWIKQLTDFSSSGEALSVSLYIPKRPFIIEEEGDVVFGQFTSKIVGMGELKRLIADLGLVHFNNNFTTSKPASDEDGGMAGGASELEGSTMTQRISTGDDTPNKHFHYNSEEVKLLPPGIEFAVITVSKPTVSDDSLAKIANEVGFVIRASNEDDLGGPNGHNPLLPSLDPKLLRAAVTRECHDGLSNYERLEFIGDAVLDYIVVRDAIAISQGWRMPHLIPSTSSISTRPILDRLATRQKQLGDLKTVVMDVCKNATLQYILPPSLVEYFKQQTETALNNVGPNLKVKADMVEALVGAVYMDNLGLDRCRYVISNLYQYLERDGAPEAGHRAFDRCPYTIFKDRPKNMAPFSPEQFDAHSKFAMDVFGGRFDCDLLVVVSTTIDKDNEIPQEKNNTAKPRPPGQVNSYAASVGFPRIQDKSFATHFSTGPVYAYRRVDEMNYTLVHSAIFAEHFYGNVAFINETIPEHEADPITSFTLDFDGCPIRFRNTDVRIAEFLRGEFKGKEGRGIVLDCSGVSVVSGNYKHSCHVHFPALKIKLSKLRSLTEGLRDYLTLCDAATSSDELRAGDFVRYGDTMAVVLIPPVTEEQQHQQLRTTIPKAPCPYDMLLSFLDTDEVELAKLREEAPIGMACVRPIEVDISKVSAKYQKELEWRQPNYNMDPNDNFRKISVPKDIVGCEGFMDADAKKAEKLATRLFQETLSGYLNKNPNHKEFWGRVVDPGLVTGKKLRSALCDKFDTVYGQEYRPLRFERFIELPTTTNPPEHQEQHSIVSNNSSVAVSSYQGVDLELGGAESYDEEEDDDDDLWRGDDPLHELLNPECHEEARCHPQPTDGGLRVIGSVDLVEETSLRGAKRFDANGLCFYPDDPSNKWDPRLPSPQEIAKGPLPNCKADQGVILVGGCTFRGVSEVSDLPKEAERHGSTDPVTIAYSTGIARCTNLGFATESIEHTRQVIASLIAPHVRQLQGPSKVHSVTTNLSALNGEKAGFMKSGKKPTVVSTDQSSRQPQQPHPPKSGGGGSKVAANPPKAAADTIITDRIKGLICPSPIACQMRYLFGNTIVKQPASFTVIYKKIRKSLFLVESTMIVVFDSHQLVWLLDMFLRDGMDNVYIVTYQDLLCELDPIGLIAPACKQIIVAQPLSEAPPHTFLSEYEEKDAADAEVNKIFEPLNANGSLSSEYWNVLCSLAQDYVLAISVEDTKLLEELAIRRMRGGAGAPQ